MTLGQEFADFAAELVEGEFGCTLQWRHIVRTENRATGAVTEASTTYTIRAAVTDPVRTRLFGDETLQQARSAVVLLPGVPFVPAVLDQVEITPGRWLAVVDVKEILGPGENGPPVLIAYAAALGVG